MDPEPPEASDDVNTPTKAPPRRGSRWISFAIALLLLAGAAVALARSEGDFIRAIDAMRDAPLWMWSALPASMLASLFLTSSVFWILTAKYGDVRLDEMCSLIGVAWVMNYLPMHPGMFGRIAYHKKYNAIRVRDTMKVTILANAQTLICIVLMPAIAYGSAILLGRSEAETFGLLQVPFVVFFGLGMILRAQGDDSWRFWSCLGIRCVEVQLWASRYWLSFAVIGMELPFSASVMIAGAVIIASMVAITGNGMGVQEWAVALVAPILPAALVAQGIEQADGLIGAFVSRAFEVAAALLAGAWGASYVGKMRKMRAGHTNARTR